MEEEEKNQDVFLVVVVLCVVLCFSSVNIKRKEEITKKSLLF